MKKILLVFVLVLFVGAINSQELTRVVGKLDNGVPIVTIDKTKAISALTSNLRKLSELDVNFKDVTIARNKDEYWLIFNGGSHKSTFNIIVDGELLKAFVGTTCTTSDCITEAEGCVPVRAPGDAYSCRPCSNHGKCTKTVSTNSLIEE